MNRKEEYLKLLSELENEPASISLAVVNAQARAKRTEHIRRFFAVPASSAAVFFIAFVIMVNVSATFASACGRIPLIKELAAAVSFSPSLSAAVKNDYIQPIELEQSANNITMRVEYVIVDQKQLNIFYSLDSEIYSKLSATPKIINKDRTSFEAFSLHSGDYGAKNGDLRQFTADFIADDMPDSLLLICKVHDNGSFPAEDMPPAAVKDSLFQEPEIKEPNYISIFEFELNFDPEFTSKGEIITLNQEFILDGQRLIVETVEIYPTHMRLKLTDTEENTAWLKSMAFFFENENGDRFDAISNGITATGSLESPMMDSHRLESSYFSQSKSLTLNITDVTWLDKDMERVKIDLVNKVADTLPNGVILEQSIRKENGWLLTFSAPYTEENHSYQLFSQKYYDDKGNEYEYMSWASGMSGVTDDITGEYREISGSFIVQFALSDYFEDTVYLSPAYSRKVTLDTPVTIKIN